MINMIEISNEINIELMNLKLRGLYTDLHLAVQKNDLKLAYLVLSRGEIGIESTTSALNLAISYKKIEMVRMILNYNVKITQKLIYDLSDCLGAKEVLRYLQREPFEKTGYEQIKSELRELEEKKVDINQLKHEAPKTIFILGLTDLHLAIESSDLSSAENILNSAALSKLEKTSALNLAIAYQKMDMVKLILNYDVEASIGLIYDISDVLGIEEAIDYLSKHSRWHSAWEKIQAELRFFQKKKQVAYSEPLVTKKSPVLSTVDVLLSHTYSDMLPEIMTEKYLNYYENSIDYNRNGMVKDVIECISSKYTVNNDKTKLIVLNDAITPNYIAYANNPEKAGGIHILSTSKTQLIREMTYMCLDRLLQNGLRPYAWYDLEAVKEYQEAAKQTLLNLASNLFNIKSHKLNNMTFQEIADDLSGYTDLWLIHIGCEKEVEDLPDFIIEAHVAAFNELSRMRYSIDYITSTFYKLVNKYNVKSSEDMAMFCKVSRLMIGGDIAQNIQVSIIGLMVESECYNLDTRIMQSFAPLQKYWADHILPKIQELKDEHIALCDEILNVCLDTGFGCSSKYTNVICIEEFM